jgi:hypothetical protein
MLSIKLSHLLKDFLAKLKHNLSDNEKTAEYKNLMLKVIRWKHT